MDINWDRKLFDLSRTGKSQKNAPIRAQVSEMIKRYDDKSKLSKAQLALTVNLRVENHEQFVVLNNNGLACTLESLMYAVQENLKSAVQVLIKQNSGLRNAKDANGNTPIHVALKLGLEDIALLLIQPPANLEEVDSEGNNLLHLAAQSKLTKVFKEIQMRCSEKKIFEKNVHNNNCIHVALQNGSSDIAKILFNGGQSVDYEVRGFNGNSYLHFAAIGDCDKDIVQFLIQNISDKDCTNLFLHTPLHVALLNGSNEAADELYKCGSNIDMNGIYNENCYHFAAQGDCYKMIDEFGEIKTEDKINGVSNLGLTPLHVALAESTITTVERLIENGANLTSLDTKGNSIYHYVAKSDMSDLIPYLSNTSPLSYQQNLAGYTPLHISIKNNSYNIFKFLIANNTNINRYCWKTKNTPLHTAATLGNWYYVYGLLLNEADPDAKNINGNTPIQLALMHNHPECVEILLLHADKIHKHFCNEGYGVMHYATNCSPNIITKIIETNSHCSLETLNEFTTDTLYHSAIKYNNLEMVEFLVRQKVPQKGNIDEVTPLHLAGSFGDFKIFKILSDQLNGDGIKARDVNGKSVLEYTISSGNKEMFDYLKMRLFDFRRPIELSRLEGNKNVLHYAAQKGHLNLMHTLLQGDVLAQVINDLDGEGLAPIHYAVKNGNLPAVECLIRFGANRNTVTSGENKTALHIAVIYNKMEIVKYLVTVGAQINALDNCGYSAVHFAVAHGHEDILIYLIQSHANTNLTTFEKKQSPLMLATVLNKVNMMKYLIECDRKMFTVGNYMQVLKMAAISTGSDDVVEFIKTYEGRNYNIIKLLSKDYVDIL